MFRHPDVSATQIAFVYAGDIWVVAKKDEEKKEKPESDKTGDEKRADDKDADEKSSPDKKGAETAKKPVPVNIDVDGFEQRVIALPPKAGNYGFLQAADGKVF